jgi:hypothetical protein
MAQQRNLYVLARTAPGVEGIEWSRIPEVKSPAHGEFIYIQHLTYRNTSRWKDVERKRPFLVMVPWHSKWGVGSNEMSSHATFAAALKAARSLQKQSAEG